MKLERPGVRGGKKNRGQSHRKSRVKVCKQRTNHTLGWGRKSKEASDGLKIEQEDGIERGVLKK